MAPSGEPGAARHSVLLFRGVDACGDVRLTRLSLAGAPRAPLHLLRGGAAPAVVEVVRARGAYTSWLLRTGGGAAVVDPCGDVTLVCAVDGLFAALPGLAAGREVGGARRFRAANELLADEGGVALGGAVGAGQLRVVCEWKEAGGEEFFRLDDGKLLKWLRYKVGRAVAGGLAKGEALDVVCAYLAPQHEAALRTAEGVVAAVEDAGAALAYAEMARSARENAAIGAENEALAAGERARKPVPAPKKKRRSAAQARLDKVDTTGIRPMTSFFSKK